MKWMTLVLSTMLLPSFASANVLTTSVGDRTVSFSLVQKNRKAWLDVRSNEIGNRRIKVNKTNQKYFESILKDACGKPLFEVGCQRYSIEIERVIGGKTIQCTYCYNSDARQAKLVRHALQALSMAVATAE